MDQIFCLLVVSHQYAFLDDLVTVAVKCEVIEVLEHHGIDVLLALRGVEQLHRLFNNMVASHVYHHFDCLVALLKSFFQNFLRALSDLRPLDTLL